MKPIALFLLTGVVCVAVSCNSPLTSSRVDLNQRVPLRTARQAIPYFLPQGKIHLIATRDATPINDPANAPLWTRVIVSSHLFTNTVRVSNQLMESNSISVFVMYSN